MPLYPPPAPIFDWRPANQGLRAWNYDPNQAQGSNVLTAGAIALLRVLVPEEFTASTLWIIVRTAGASLTSNQNFAGLYSAGGTRLALTADQTTAWGTNGAKSMALTGSVALARGVYYVALLANGGTPPTLARGIATASINFNLASGGLRFATILAGQTSLPASLTMTDMSEDSGTYWAGVS